MCILYVLNEDTSIKLIISIVRLCWVRIVINQKKIFTTNFSKGKKLDFFQVFLDLKDPYEIDKHSEKR